MFRHDVRAKTAVDVNELIREALSLQQERPAEAQDSAADRAERAPA